MTARMRHPRRLVRAAGVTFLLACAIAPAAAGREAGAGAPAAPPAGAAPSAAPLFSARDARIAVAASIGIGILAFNDRWLTEEATESDTRLDVRTARAAEHLGNPRAVGPALALAWGAGWLSGRTALADGAARTALAAGIAGAACGALKVAIGRERPYESPDHADRFRPFSGHESFPSGHSTVAFALAAALDRESGSRWVRWTAYPAAGLVAWSRVRDDRHWTSDVLAGAVLGAWTAGKVETFARARAGPGGSRALRIEPRLDAARLGIAARF
jgi:undecaprenyl-diphosphatase